MKDDRMEKYGAYILTLSSSQSSIAAMKNPIPIPIGVVCGCARGCRGGGGREESSSISRLLRNSGAPFALKHIVHKSSSLYTLFLSVIYNSVPPPNPTFFLFSHHSQ